jgi:hypothetical protein
MSDIVFSAIDSLKKDCYLKMVLCGWNIYTAVKLGFLDRSHYLFIQVAPQLYNFEYIVTRCLKAGILEAAYPIVS